MLIYMPNLCDSAENAILDVVYTQLLTTTVTFHSGSYGPVLRYLPVECYASGINMRLEMILGALEKCNWPGREQG